VGRALCHKERGLLWARFGEGSSRPKRVVTAQLKRTRKYLKRSAARVAAGAFGFEASSARLVFERNGHSGHVKNFQYTGWQERSSSEIAVEYEIALTL
jgi:hypothetical protein